MTFEEQALLAAIAAHPEADLPRLVYSDWLQERNDERFEMVRDRELFGWMGPNAENPVPKLLDALLDAYSDDERMRPLLGLLARCGPAVVGPLVARLREGHPWEDFARELASDYPAKLAEHRAELEGLLATGSAGVRDVALELLVRAGVDDPASLRVVLDWSLRPDEGCARSSYAALGLATGAAAEAVVAEWLPDLERDMAEADLDDPDRTESRTECLAALPVESARLTAYFRQAVSRPNTRLAAAASAGLVRSREAAREAVAAALRNCTADTVSAAVDLARAAGDDWRERVATAAMAFDTSPTARAALLSALPWFDGEKWAVAAPVYSAGVRHADAAVRKAALAALGNSGGPPAAVAGLIQEAANDRDPEVRIATLDARLARDLPPHRRTAVIADALGGSDREVARRAFEVAGYAVETDALLRRFRDQLANGDEQARARAVAGLGRLCEREPSHFGEVFGHLHDRQPAVRRATAHILSEVLNEGATGVLRPLRQALADPDPGVRQGAALALTRIGNEAHAAVPDLLKLTRDREPQARAGALRALPSIISGDTAVDQALICGLRDPVERVVHETLIGLKRRYKPEPAIQEAILPWTRHPKSALRLAAFGAMESLDEEAVLPEAIAAIRAGLADADAGVAKAAFETVYSIRKVAGPLADDLIAALGNPTCPFRESMTWVLEEVPTAPAKCVSLLGSPDAEVRQRVLGLIRSVSEKAPDQRVALAAAAVPFLPGLLARERGEKLLTILDLILVAGPAVADCYESLLPLLDHSNPAVRERAFATVGRLGPVALPVKDRLTDVLLNDPNENVRAAAGASVVSLAEHDASLVPVVASQLREAAVAVRRTIAERCGLHPALGPALIPSLAKCFTPPPDDTRLRETVATALGKMGEAMRRYAVDFARAVVREPDWQVRQYMFDACGELGGAAAEAVPLLMAYFPKEPNPQVRAHLIRAFTRIPCPQRGPAVALGLADPDSGVRDNVGTYLGDIGADAVAILPQLCAAVANPRWDNMNDSLLAKFGRGDFFASMGLDRREFLLDAIAKLGPAAEPAIPTLVKLLSDKHEGVRHSAIDALVAVGPVAADALKKATRHRDPVVRETAEVGLKEMRESM